MKIVVLKDNKEEVDPWRSPWTNPTTEELFANGPMITILLSNGLVLSGKYQFWDGKVDTHLVKIHLTHTEGWVLGANRWLRYEKN